MGTMKREDTTFIFRIKYLILFYELDVFESHLGETDFISLSAENWNREVLLKGDKEKRGKGP